MKTGSLSKQTAKFPSEVSPQSEYGKEHSQNTTQCDQAEDDQMESGDQKGV
jgi:hypothetical protein